MFPLEMYNLLRLKLQAIFRLLTQKSCFRAGRCREKAGSVSIHNGPTPSRISLQQLGFGCSQRNPLLGTEIAALV